MQTITINGKDYKIKYGFNSFADTDLLDKVGQISTILNGSKDDSDVAAMGKIKDLFLIVRELIFVGFEKCNPVESLEEVGNLLDDYRDEAPDDENRSLLGMFIMLSDELTNEGFLSDLLNQVENTPKTPSDHKKKSK